MRVAVTDVDLLLVNRPQQSPWVPHHGAPQGGGNDWSLSTQWMQGNMFAYLQSVRKRVEEKFVRILKILGMFLHMFPYFFAECC